MKNLYLTWLFISFLSNFHFRRKGINGKMSVFQVDVYKITIVGMKDWPKKWYGLSCSHDYFSSYEWSEPKFIWKFGWFKKRFLIVCSSWNSHGNMRKHTIFLVNFSSFNYGNFINSFFLSWRFWPKWGSERAKIAKMRSPQPDYPICRR